MKFPKRNNNNNQKNDDDFVRACRLALHKIPIKPNEDDGSGRMLMCARQCKKFGMSHAQSIKLLREYEAERPFPGSPVAEEWINKRLRDADVIHGEARDENWKPDSPSNDSMPWERVDPETGEDLPRIDPAVTDWQQLENEYMLLVDEAGGFLGDYCNYFLKHAVKPQPAYAIGGALALVSILIGRKITTTFNTSANLQCVLLGETGMGKEFARKMNSKILGEIAAWDLLGAERYASDKALMKELRDTPALLLQIDEFGRIMKSANNANSSHEANFVTLLLKLFEQSSNERFCHGRAAGDEQRVTVDRPWVTLLGTGTPKGMFSGMSEDMIFDGFLNRCLVIESTIERRMQLSGLNDPFPSSILGFASHWFRTDPDDPVKVTMHPEALATLMNLDETIYQMLRRSNHHRALIVRQSQKVRQVAVLKAVSDAGVGQFDPKVEVTDEAAKWAMRLVQNADKVLAKRVDTGFAVNRQQDLSNRLLEVIRQSGKKGISRTELIRRSQWCKATDRMDLIYDLLAGGLIFESQIETKTKPRTIYIESSFGG